MKKLFVASVLTLLAVFFITLPVYANEIIVTIDDQRVIFEGQSPVIVEGRTLVPVRGVFEMLGFDVEWEPTTRTAILTNESYEVRIQIGQAVFYTNGVAYQLDVPAQIIGGSTMVPLRLPLESVGYYLDWVGSTRTVLISSVPFPTTTMPTAWQSSASYANAPYFYGATRITVPVGTHVDLRSGMFRLMAHDVFDGDITHKMTMYPATVDTSRVGTSTVRYTVTNSRGVTTTRIVYVIAEARENVVVERVVHSMPYADKWASYASSQIRGLWQCAQHLGIYMPPHSSFEIRMLEGNSYVWVRSYAGIVFSHLDTPLQPDGRIETISHYKGVMEYDRPTIDVLALAPNMGRIPMIKTPRSDTGHFTVELTFTLTGPGSVMGLDYFHYGDTNQSEFLANWTEDRMFAMIGSSSVTIMVPWNDRAYLAGSYFVYPAPMFPLNSINEILSFYNQIFADFHRWNGFCINSANPVNRLIHARWLVLPAFGGGGFAFISLDHLAMSGGPDGFHDRPIYGGHSVWAYLYKSWLVLHEIGHSFDGSIVFRDHNNEPRLGEIATNVPAHFMQRSFADPNQWWLYGASRYSRAALEINALANANGIFTQGYHEGLFLLMGMLETTGDEYAAWARVQSLNREMRAIGEVWSLADLFAKALFEVSGLNMIPYLEWIGFEPSRIIREYIFASNARIPYFLNALTNRQDRLSFDIMQREGLQGIWCAVLPSDSRGLYGNATITVGANYIGQTIRIRDGVVVVREITITSQSVYINNLPIGAYSIEISGTSNQSVLFVRADEVVFMVESPSTPVAEGAFFIRNQAGRYLAIIDGVLSCSPIRGNNVWYLQETGLGSYFIYANSPASRRRIDLWNNWDAEDIVVQMFASSGHIPAQMWFFMPNGNGTYQIRTSNTSNRVITSNNGEPPTIQTFQWLETQTWTLIH